MLIEEHFSLPGRGRGLPRVPHPGPAYQRPGHHSGLQRGTQVYRPRHRPDRPVPAPQLRRVPHLAGCQGIGAPSPRPTPTSASPRTAPSAACTRRARNRTSATTAATSSAPASTLSGSRTDRTAPEPTERRHAVAVSRPSAGGDAGCQPLRDGLHLFASRDQEFQAQGASEVFRDWQQAGYSAQACRPAPGHSGGSGCGWVTARFSRSGLSVASVGASRRGCLVSVRRQELEC